MNNFEFRRLTSQKRPVHFTDLRNNLYLQHKAGLQTEFNYLVIPLSENTKYTISA